MVGKSIENIIQKSKFLILGISALLLLFTFSKANADNFIEVTLGNSSTDAKYHSLKEIFDDTSLEGEISVNMLSNVSNTVSKDEDRLIIPNRFTTLKITSDNPQTLMITNSASKEAYQALFANGKNLIIDKNIKISKAETFGNVNIYGGNVDKDITEAGTITIDGTVTGILYGGGYNSSVKGNPTIVVNGKIGTVYGGGLASTGLSVLPEQAKANVTGNINIKVGENGSITNIYGGGRASNKNTNASSSLYNNVANVDGNIKILVDGKNSVVHGGGYAGSAISEPYTNFKATANVSGNIDIEYGADAQDTSSSYMEVYGGGMATTNLAYNNEVKADVGGSVSIKALKDSIASTSQQNSRSFSRFFGGGYAYGENSTANVAGNIDIKTARPCFESAFGLVGGGWAMSGATANVNGSVNITGSPIEGQKSNYANFSTIIGGGYAGGGASRPNTTANVGSTNIYIAPGTFNEGSSSNYSVAILGGGLAYDTQSYAKVINDTNIIIGDNSASTTINDKVYGGGLSKGEASNATVHGNANLTMNKVINNTQYNFGGGYAVGKDSVANVDGYANFNIDHGSTLKYSAFGGGNATGTNSEANVNKVNMTLNDNSAITNNAIIGGGFAPNANTTAKVNNVNLTISNNSKPGSNLGTGYYVYGGGKSTNNGHAEVINSTINLDNVDFKHYISSNGTGTNATVSGKKEINVSGNTKVEGIYSSETISVKANSELTVYTKSYSPFDAKEFFLPETSKLIVYNSINVNGDFHGGGTITIPSDKKVTVDGFVHGETTLDLVGDVKFDVVYAKAKENSPGHFVWASDNLILEKIKNSETGENIWQLREKSKEKELISFDFLDTISDITIDKNNKKINITVPYTVDIKALIATFKVSDHATLLIGNTAQESGKTVNDFSKPIVYKVMAENGDVDEYTVNLKIKDKPKNNANIKVDNIGDKIAFSTSGAGMDNKNPKIGDTRWKPTKWALNDETKLHKYIDGKTEISLTDLKAGSNTLYMFYQLQIYDGEMWVDVPGEMDKKVETFEIQKISGIPNTYDSGVNQLILNVILLIIASSTITYVYVNRNNKKTVYAGGGLMCVTLILFLLPIVKTEVTNNSENKKIDSFFKEQQGSAESNVALANTSKTDNNYTAVLEIPEINLKKGLVAPDSRANIVSENIQIMNDSTMPNEKNGNMILAAHSGNGPKGYFKNLKKLKENNEIYVYYQGNKYIYKITDIYEMDKTGEIIAYKKENTASLTLTTCSDNNKQLVVVATMIKTVNI